MTRILAASARAGWLAAGVTLAAALVVGGGAAAGELSASGPVTASQAISRPTPPGIAVGVVYLTLVNRGAAPDRLVAVDTPVAAGAEIHATVTAGGLMQMRRMAGVDLSPGAVLRFESGGAHIMLTGLRRPLVAGEEFPLSLHFERAGAVVVAVRVAAAY